MDVWKEGRCHVSETNPLVLMAKHLKMTPYLFVLDSKLHNITLAEMSFFHPNLVKLKHVHVIPVRAAGFCGAAYGSSRYTMVETPLSIRG